MRREDVDVLPRFGLLVFNVCRSKLVVEDVESDFLAVVRELALRFVQDGAFKVACTGDWDG